MRNELAVSVLDLVGMRAREFAGSAIARSVNLAQHVEKLGYRRCWLAEHHSVSGLACSATAVLIGHVAGATKTIRVGSGGVMLPNHAPLVVAEQFGTLEALYPGRIDLGLGRAPGGDFETMRALRRDLRQSGSLTDNIAHESGSIHAHESDERAEIKHLSAETVTHHKRTNQRDCTYKQHVTERGDAVEADVGEHGDRGSSEHGLRVPQARVVERPRVEASAVVRMPENVARRDHKENCDHHSHRRRQRRVHARRSFYSLNVQQRKHQRKEDNPRPVRHAGSKHVRLLAAPMVQIIGLSM